MGVKFGFFQGNPVFFMGFGKKGPVSLPRLDGKTECVYEAPVSHASYFCPGNAINGMPALAQVANETSSSGTVWRQCNIDSIAMIESQSIMRF